MFAISTAWFATKARSGTEIADRIRALGVHGVEVDYRVTEQMVADIEERLRRGELRVSSVHNPSPLPDWMEQSKASGDALKLSSTDEEERKGAVRLALRSLELAHRLGATAVVFHLGEVEMDHQSDRFFELYKQGKINSPEADRLRREKLQERRAKRQRNLDAVLRSLEEINEAAARTGVLLGIETRYRYHQIPDLEEFGILFEHFQGGQLRYWHDVGHAQVHQALGFWSQDEPLKRYGHLLAGFHLHDCFGVDDHRAPGDGDVDWELLIPYLKPHVLKVMEIHPKVSPEQAEQGIAFLRKIGAVELADLQLSAA